MAKVEVRWFNEQELSCWMAFLDMQKLLMETLDRELRDQAGVCLDDYDVLAQLSAAPEKRLRMSELAEAVIMPKSRLTYRIDRLVKRGCVARIDCKDDRRGLFAELTPAGELVLERAAPFHVTSVRNNFCDPVGEKSAAEMCRLASNIRDHLVRARNP
jgi:DNA-binding MarR family transcriptional regulator